MVWRRLFLLSPIQTRLILHRTCAWLALPRGRLFCGERVEVPISVAIFQRPMCAGRVASAGGGEKSLLSRRSDHGHDYRATERRGCPAALAGQPGRAAARPGGGVPGAA